MHRGLLSVEYESATSSKLETLVCKGLLSTLVKAVVVVYSPCCRGGTTALPIKTTAQGKDLLEVGNLNTIDNHGAPLSER
jgi:hypothetical protein